MQKIVAATFLHTSFGLYLYIYIVSIWNVNTHHIYTYNQRKQK